MNGKITIVDGENRYIADCTEILQNPELGKAYFSDRQKATGMLEYALEKKELYIALNEQGECVGFIYCMQNGVFGSSDAWKPEVYLCAAKPLFNPAA